MLSLLAAVLVIKTLQPLQTISVSVPDPHTYAYGAGDAVGFRCCGAFDI